MSSNKNQYKSYISIWIITIFIQHLMIIWSIKIQFQVKFLLTSYKTKHFWKKVRCFLIQSEFYLNSCLVSTADCLLFAICHVQISGNYDAALASRSDSVVELFPVYLQTVLNLFTVQTDMLLVDCKRNSFEFLQDDESMWILISGRSPNSRV